MKAPSILLALMLAASPAWAARQKATSPAISVPPRTAATALVVQARGAAASGNTELAERLAQSAIVADPADTFPYVALGDVYAGTGQRDYARSYYQAALNIDPQEPAALKALAALDKLPVTAQGHP